jgi:3-hydroxyisobutyrate dehydrogenase-like beta-hydroxyacid dehydrogenase
MAHRIVKAGIETYTTFHRRREPADELARAGAKIVGSPAEVARAADVVITILPADAELIETVCRANGVAESFSPGKVLIDMTTSTPNSMVEVERAISGAGGRVLDAPVSGGTTGAIAGSLTIMVGGDAGLLEEQRPLLQHMGTRIVHVGAVGQGKVVKIINQMMAAIHLLTMGEAFALGVRCGADPNTMYDVIKESSGHSKMMDLRLRDFLLAGSFEPGFKLDLMKKDVQLAMDAGRAQGVPLLLTSLASQVFSAASLAGHGGEDFSAAAQFLAGLGAVRLDEQSRHIDELQRSPDI